MNLAGKPKPRRLNIEINEHNVGHRATVTAFHNIALMKESQRKDAAADERPRATKALLDRLVRGSRGEPPEELEEAEKEHQGRLKNARWRRNQERAIAYNMEARGKAGELWVAVNEATEKRQLDLMRQTRDENGILSRPKIDGRRLSTRLKRHLLQHQGRRTRGRWQK